jgi:hypothetical protein
MSPIANARRFAATALGDSLHHLEGGVRRHSGVTVGAGIERVMMPAFADLKVISPVAPYRCHPRIELLIPLLPTLFRTPLPYPVPCTEKNGQRKH